MSRPDLLRLNDAVLEDLTNKGTLRRARKELGAAALTVTEADDGTGTVSSDDGTTCVRKFSFLHHGFKGFLRFFLSLGDDDPLACG